MGFFKRLFGGGAAEEVAPSTGTSGGDFAARMASQRKEREAKRAAQAETEKALAAPGPLACSALDHFIKEAPQATASVSRDDACLNFELTVGGKQYGLKVPYTCIHGISAGSANVRIDFHIPVPIWDGSGYRAARTLRVDFSGDGAAARWRKVSEMYFYREAACPRCHSPAMDIGFEKIGSPEGPPQPGRAATAGRCKACSREFIYDYSNGGFIETSAAS